MIGAPISAEARGRLRELWMRLENDARRVERAAISLPKPMLRDLAKKAPLGAERTLARILAAMPLRPFYCDGRSVAFRYLFPVSAVPAADGGAPAGADGQPAIVVKAVLINAGGGRPRMTRELFGTCFTKHAIGRLLDRSGMRADPTEAMFAAHAALLALGPIMGGALLDGRREIPLPAAGGAFLAAARRVGRDGRWPLCVARTWLDGGQLHDDQAARVAAWGLSDRPAA
jgi:hypothetical protein